MGGPVGVVCEPVGGDCGKNTSELPDAFRVTFDT